MPKIVFFGTSEFAVPALKGLIKGGIPPAAVVTSPDRPAGRKKKLRTSPVKSWIIEYEAYNEKLIQQEKLDHDFILRVSNLMPNIGIIAAYGKILPKELIDIFPQGILNIHSSLLPKYRGASPIQSAILNGDSETGVSIILFDQKRDDWKRLLAWTSKFTRFSFVRSQTWLSLMNNISSGLYSYIYEKKEKINEILYRNREGLVRKK